MARSQNVTKDCGDGLVGAKVNFVKPEDLSSIPGTHMMEEKINNCQKLSSDLSTHIHGECYGTHTHTHTHTHTDTQTHKHTDK